ncbi:hypothetical protein ACLOJK_039078 [Asimina triloba]
MLSDLYVSRSIPPKKMNKICQESKPNSPESQKLSEPSTQAAPIRREVNESNKTTPIQTAAKLDETADCITEEWEQLMVTEVGCNYSPTCISKPKFENMQSPASDGHKPMNEKTSRILERLEAPKQQKTKESPPLPFSNFRRDECRAMKKPLVPFGPNHAADQGQGLSMSQPIKPNFQRAKRKHQEEKTHSRAPVTICFMHTCLLSISSSSKAYPSYFSEPHESDSASVLETQTL